jgi:hypothetical protein
MEGRAYKCFGEFYFSKTYFKHVKKIDVTVMKI